MVFGTHLILYSTDAEADRAFLRDVLGFSAVDAGHGWLIFALPPAEVAVHPATAAGRAELYLMCDDLRAEIRVLEEKGVRCAKVREERWGSVTSVRLPGGVNWVYTNPGTRRRWGWDRTDCRVLDSGGDSEVNSISSAKWLGFLLNRDCLVAEAVPA